MFYGCFNFGFVGRLCRSWVYFWIVACFFVPSLVFSQGAGDVEEGDGFTSNDRRVLHLIQGGVGAVSTTLSGISLVLADDVVPTVSQIASDTEHIGDMYSELRTVASSTDSIVRRIDNTLYLWDTQGFPSPPELAYIDVNLNSVLTVLRAIASDVRLDLVPDVKESAGHLLNIDTYSSLSSGYLEEIRDAVSELAFISTNGFFGA